MTNTRASQAAFDHGFLAGMYFAATNRVELGDGRDGGEALNDRDPAEFSPEFGHALRLGIEVQIRAMKLPPGTPMPTEATGLYESFSRLQNHLAEIPAKDHDTDQRAASLLAVIEAQNDQIDAKARDAGLPPEPDEGEPRATDADFGRGFYAGVRAWVAYHPGQKGEA